MLKTDYSETVRRAAKQNGGYARLVRRLGVKLADVTAWGDGVRAPTPAALLRLVDVILEDTGKLRKADLRSFRRR